MKTLIVTLVSCLFVFADAGAVARSTNVADKVLWRDPGPIARRDLLWGPGNPDRAPKPPFTFVRENTSGSKPKIDVTDASGVMWSVKLALPDAGKNETHAEIAATRLVWAFGYFVDENYFVPSGRIDGVHGLTRAAPVVASDGSFTGARFERREKGVEPRGDWNIEDNDFRGTRELAGLQALMMLLASWDATPLNSAVVRSTLPDGREEDRYYINDLGSTFGRMRGGMGKSPSRWSLEDYRDGRLVNGIVLDKLEFRAPLLGARPLAIPATHARWFTDMAVQLTDRQIRQAFEAAGASQTEIDGFSAAVKARIQELRDKLAGR